MTAIPAHILFWRSIHRDAAPDSPTNVCVDVKCEEVGALIKWDVIVHADNKHNRRQIAVRSTADRIARELREGGHDARVVQS